MAMWRRPEIFIEWHFASHWANWEAEATTESMALFSQNTLTLTDKTFFDFGFRVNHEKIGVRLYELFCQWFCAG